MKTTTTQLRRYSIGLTIAAVCAASLPLHAQTTVTVRAAASKQENIGVATGLAVGAVTGGPVGAIVGAVAGAWMGDRYHKQLVARTELAASLNQVLSRADDVQTDVGFRTNDDSIPTQALPPLMKLGALAAALPDARVRVAGYADPRGSQEVNDSLSKRRAEAVAAVLQSAGVPKDRLTVEGHGKSESASADGDLDAYAFDRRVSVWIERARPAAVASNE